MNIALPDLRETMDSSEPFADIPNLPSDSHPLTPS